MPTDLGYLEWEPCPNCEGRGMLDASAPGDPPGSCLVDCHRCGGEGGWSLDDEDEDEDDGLDDGWGPDFDDEEEDDGEN